jgi:hypothetical protein
VRAAAWLVVAGCGRIAFDPVPPGPGGGDAANDGVTAAPFVVDLGGGPSWVHAMVALPDGSTAIGGYSNGATSFGTSSIGAFGGGDIVLAVVDRNGSVRWATSYGSTGDDELYALATDPTGNIYATGIVSGPMSFGGPTLGAANGDVFVASFAPDGTYRWSRGFGGVNEDSGRGIAVASDGDVVVVGDVGGTFDFGNGTQVTAVAASSDAFVARWASDGTLRWGRHFGANSGPTNSLRAVAIDGAGNVYSTGFYEGTVDFGRGPETASGTTNAVVLALDSTGGYRWDQTFSGTGLERGDGLALVDQTLVIAGMYSSAIGLSVPAASDGDALVVAYSTAGALAWALGFGNAGCDRLYSATADGSEVLIGGRFSGTIDLGTGPHSAVGRTDSLAFSVTAAGVVTSVTSFGTALDDGANAAIGPSSTPIVAGFEGSPAWPATCVIPGTTNVRILSGGTGYVRGL